MARRRDSGVSPDAQPPRTCQSCSKKKPFGDFRKSRSCPSGRDWTCKKCDTERHRKSTSCILPLGPEQTSRYCRRCWTDKPLSAFTIDANCRSDRTWKCTECLNVLSLVRYARVLADPEKKKLRRTSQGKARDRWRAKNLDYARSKSRVRRAANPDQARAIVREWQKNNRERFLASIRNRKRRVRSAPGSHTGDDIRDIFRLQTGRCANPACRISLDDGYHVDHIEPIRWGGSNYRNNLQLLCGPCNLRKKDRDPIDFMREQGFLL